MKSFSLTVVGTGSDGNCYLLNVNGKILVIEAGVNFSKVKKALNFDLSGVVGVLVSHEHGDHAKYIKDFQKFGKYVWQTEGTFKRLKLDKGYWLRYLEQYNIGGFLVTPFKTFHDAAEPCGFLIEFEGKRLAFITDTSDLKVGISNVDYWIIEANYSNNKLRDSSLDPRLKKRIQDTHMSIDRCKTILDAHGAENSDFVLLIHASKHHADKEEFLTKIPYAAIAEDGLIIDL